MQYACRALPGLSKYIVEASHYHGMVMVGFYNVFTDMMA